MTKKRYEPPKQSGIGQFIDSVFLLGLVYLVLFIPLVFNLAGADAITNIPAVVTWETLGQNEVMQRQWEALGYDAEAAAELISTRFVYDINPISLILTAVVILGYFVFLVRISDKEYREVIAEKFDN